MPSARRSTCSGLEVGATPVEIKASFKVLVKRHHPDANGGDRSTEDRLREIIQAYNYLKSVGFADRRGLAMRSPPFAGGMPISLKH